MLFILDCFTQVMFKIQHFSKYLNWSPWPISFHCWDDVVVICSIGYDSVAPLGKLSPENKLMLGTGPNWPTGPSQAYLEPVLTENTGWPISTKTLQISESQD